MRNVIVLKLGSQIEKYNIHVCHKFNFLMGIGLNCNFTATFYTYLLSQVYFKICQKEEFRYYIKENMSEKKAKNDR